MSEKECFEIFLTKIEEIKRRQEEDSRLMRSFMAAIDENLYEYSQKIFQLEKSRNSLAKSES